jgi:hypothetical protein
MWKVPNYAEVHGWKIYHAYDPKGTGCTIARRDSRRLLRRLDRRHQDVVAAAEAWYRYEQKHLIGLQQLKG